MNSLKKIFKNFALNFSFAFFLIIHLIVLVGVFKDGQFYKYRSLLLIPLLLIRTSIEFYQRSKIIDPVKKKYIKEMGQDILFSFGGGVYSIYFINYISNLIITAQG